MRYFIEFSYRGTQYRGFQIQPNGITIQEVLEEALSKILRQKTEITGSSRTDTGVHAKIQMAHFEANTPIIDTEKVVYQLNKILPFDVAIHRVFEVENDYHSRFDALSRKYEYHITHQKNPFGKDLAYYFTGNLDLALMNEACKILKQYDDFQAFSKVHTQVHHFRCKIEEAHWHELPTGWVFYIKADRFLRGMVRAIVGTLLEVGLGKTSLSDFEGIILSRDRRRAGRAVPPEGLYLVEVNYPEYVSAGT